MKFERYAWFLFVLTVGTACSLAVVSDSCAQKGPASANPLAPTIAPLSPSGVQPGHTLEFFLTGTNLADPIGIYLGTPAKISIPKDGKNGSDNSKCKVRIEMPEVTPVGCFALRLATLKGVSNLRLFCVDDLPPQNANGTNHAKEMAQSLPVPCVVAGTVAAAQGDFFKIQVKAGQRLSFDCLARRLGSVIDAEMRIYDVRSMRELAYDNDSPGCQTDPRISYTFKEAGEYLVELKDVQNLGGADAFYRLRIGDFPLATTAMPMAARRGSKAKIGFTGPALEGVAAVEVNVPTNPALNVVWVAPKGPGGLYGWPVPLAISDQDEVVEKEPNNEPAAANRIMVPGGVSGRFQASDDTDYYVFSARKGQKLAIEAQTQELSSPSLVYLVLKNAKTLAEIGKSTPQTPPPGDQRIEVTAAEDQDYLLEVTHLHFAGGPSEAYHLTVQPTNPTFDLVLPGDRFDFPPGGAAAIPVQVLRKGFIGPIELSATGAGELAGSAKIGAGQTSGLLMVSAKSTFPAGPFALTILGTAMIDGKTVVKAASTKASIVQALNGLPFPPPDLLTSVAVSIKEKLPFSLAIKMDPPEGVPGGTAKVTVTVNRDKGFADEITLNPPAGLPATIPVPKLVPIAKDKTEATFPLDLNAKTPLGQYFVFLTAKTKYQGKEVFAAAPPLILTLELPFDLKVEPSKVSLKPGEKAKLKITATRKGGYKGPIAVDVRKLPANVTAIKATIAADQTTADVEISAAPAAAPVVQADVDVAGTATALNNLQNASPAITVSVLKK